MFNFSALRQFAMETICRVFDHKRMRSGLMSSLCSRCDKTLYDEPVAAQGKAWEKRRNEMWEARNRPKYAIRSVAA